MNLSDVVFWRDGDKGSEADALKRAFHLIRLGYRLSHEKPCTILGLSLLFFRKETK